MIYCISGSSVWGSFFFVKLHKRQKERKCQKFNINCPFVELIQTCKKCSKTVDRKYWPVVIWRRREQKVFWKIKERVSPMYNWRQNLKNSSETFISVWNKKNRYSSEIKKDKILQFLWQAELCKKLWESESDVLLIPLPAEQDSRSGIRFYR